MAFRPMRRSRQQLSPAETEEILLGGSTGVLAVNGDGGYPYAVPVNYVYRDGKIYFHGAVTGHKFDAMARDGRVCFCVIGRDQVVPEELTDYYQSVVVFGRVRLLAGRELVSAANALGLRFYDAPAAVARYVQDSLPHLACFELTPEHVTGKQGKGLLKGP